MTLAALFALLKPALAPLIAALLGWLIPSPGELARQAQAQNAQAEAAADDPKSGNDVSNLDKLP